MYLWKGQEIHAEIEQMQLSMNVTRLNSYNCFSFISIRIMLKTGEGIKKEILDVYREKERKEMEMKCKKCSYPRMQPE